MRVIEMPMYYNASPEMLKRAGDLRENMTEAESALWKVIGKKKRVGVTFRRQHPIWKFVVDFYCHEALLVVEVDGGIHKNKDVAEHDEGREIELKKLGLDILRFTNEEVLRDMDKVVKSIQIFIKAKGMSFPFGKDER